MLGWLRPHLAKVWEAPARGLVAIGVHPNAVTLVGTLGIVLASLLMLPRGGQWLAWGAVTVAFFALSDMLDGNMARLSGKSSRFGAFLDSLMDRVSDTAIFAGLAWAFWEASPLTAAGAIAALAVGTFVPYARARAAAVGVDASRGLAERSDRLAIAGVATLAVGLGAPVSILTATLWVLVLLAAITTVQRTLAVLKADRAGTTVEFGQSGQ